MKERKCAVKKVSWRETLGVISVLHSVSVLLEEPAGFVYALFLMPFILKMGS